MARKKKKKAANYGTIYSAYKRQKDRAAKERRALNARNKALKTNAKKIQAAKRAGKSTVSLRKERVKIISRYNAAKKARLNTYKLQDKIRQQRLDKLPKRLNSRNLTDIWEHFDIQRTFATDTMKGGISDIVQGQIPGTTQSIDEEYDELLDEVYGEKPKVLNLGITDISGNIEWILDYTPDGVPVYTANVNVPNSDEFFTVVARISPL